MAQHSGQRAYPRRDRQAAAGEIRKGARHLKALPVHPYDIATILPMRASSQFRSCVDTNRYSVPAEYAGWPLTVKAYPDRLCIYDRALVPHKEVVDENAKG